MRCLLASLLPTYCEATEACLPPTTTVPTRIARTAQVAVVAQDVGDTGHGYGWRRTHGNPPRKHNHFSIDGPTMHAAVLDASRAARRFSGSGTRHSRIGFR